MYWLWGGFSVDNPTLNKFFSLHYLLPFCILGVVILHVILLHEHGSNNPLGIRAVTDQVAFSPYSTYKDIYTIISNGNTATYCSRMILFTILCNFTIHTR